MFSVVYELEFNNSLDKLRLKIISHYAYLLSTGRSAVLGVTNTKQYSATSEDKMTGQQNLKTRSQYT
jgi:L-cystine uptake protein TcyP (sodium:dicarboxylate symporter family)